MNSVVTLTAALACGVVQQGDLYRLVSPYDHDYASLMNLGLPIRLGEKDYDSAVFEFFAE